MMMTMTRLDPFGQSGDRPISFDRGPSHLVKILILIVMMMSVVMIMIMMKMMMSRVMSMMMSRVTLMTLVLMPIRCD